MNPLEFIRFTAGTNCGECGQLSCLAFAVAVTKGGADPAGCPHLDPAFQAAEKSYEDSGLEKVERGGTERDMALVEHLKTKIRDVDFAAVSKRLGAQWSSERPQVLTFRFLGREVELAKNELRMEGSPLVDPRDQILLYNYVAYGGGDLPAGEWIGMESLPNSISKVRTLSAYCEQPLAKHFSGKPARLAKACEKAGGIPGGEESSASVSYIIPVLPRLPHYLLFWDEAPEDGFESRVKVLFDRNVLDYLDIESLVFAAERMAEYLQETER